MAMKMITSVTLQKLKTKKKHCFDFLDRNIYGQCDVYFYDDGVFNETWLEENLCENEEYMYLEYVRDTDYDTISEVEDFEYDEYLKYVEEYEYWSSDSSEW
jgi:hypothetical protein